MRACGLFAQELQRARAAGGAWGSTNEFATPLATKSIPQHRSGAARMSEGGDPHAPPAAFVAQMKGLLTEWHCALA